MERKIGSANDLLIFLKNDNGVLLTGARQEMMIIMLEEDAACKKYEGCFFSDGHATDNLTTFYNKTKINDLPAIIDWDAVKAKYWGGQDNLNKKRKKQAEFLIPDDLSSNLIVGMVCYNESTKKKLVTMGVEENEIKIIPNAYY